MDPYPSTYLNLGDDTLAWLAMSAFRPAVHVVTWARTGTNSLEPLDTLWRDAGNRRRARDDDDDEW